MNKFVGLFLFLTFSACEAVQDEFYTSGGYVAPLLDETTFPAATQREQFHRYYYIAAVSAPLALYTVSDEEGADDTIGHVVRTFKQLKRYKASLENCVERHKNNKDRTDQTCRFTETRTQSGAASITISLDVRDTSYGFETNSLDAQRNLARLATDVKNNVGLQIDAQNPVSIIENLVDILRTAKDLIGPLRNFAAAYRDTIHITTLSVARMCEAQKQSNPNKKQPKCDRYVGVVEKYYDNGTHPKSTLLPEGQKEQQRALKVLRDNFEHVITSKELGDKGFLDDEAINALNSLMFTSCKHAARYVDWDSGEKDEVCSALVIPKFDPQTLITVSDETSSESAPTTDDASASRGLSDS